MSFTLKCPVCGLPLERSEKAYRCAGGHSFDIAKQGYVNLLMSQKSSSKRHGDDALMVNARSAFLASGYYDCLFEGLLEAVLSLERGELKIADLGCGECSYTAFLAKETQSRGVSFDFCGIDISKRALMSGAKKDKSLTLAVASTADLPFFDGSCDVVMTVFAPYSESEIFRVLKPGGAWIRAFPLEKHLMGLKSLIYETPYENKVDREAAEGFVLSRRQEIKRRITIKESETVKNLFMMTPYYYKTAITDQQKLFEANGLATEIEFGIYTQNRKNL